MFEPGVLRCHETKNRVLMKESPKRGCRKITAKKLLELYTGPRNLKKNTRPSSCKDRRWTSEYRDWRESLAGDEREQESCRAQIKNHSTTKFVLIRSPDRCSFFRCRYAKCLRHNRIDIEAEGRSQG